MQPVHALVLATSPVTPLANHQQFLFLCLLLLAVLVGIGALLWQILLLGDRIGRVEKSMSRVRSKLSSRTHHSRKEGEEEIEKEVSSESRHSRSRRMTEIDEDDEGEDEDDEDLPQKLPVKYTCSCGRKWKISSPGHYKCKCGKKFTV